tara:strand:- start:22 stop:225 length:204 start_codon:yes stop_codon:yes gene_type:complete
MGIYQIEYVSNNKKRKYYIEANKTGGAKSKFGRRVNAYVVSVKKIKRPTKWQKSSAEVSPKRKARKK